MTAAFLALLPVFIVILAGYGLRRSRLVVEEQWTAIDHISYFVLFPVIMFKEIVAADFAHVPVFNMALAMALAAVAEGRGLTGACAASVSGVGTVARPAPVSR